MTEVSKQLDIDAIIEEATLAAVTATNEYLEKYPDQWYPCGFAWVNIKPARGPLVARLKELGNGYTDTYYGGYTVSNPAKNSTQCMDAKEAGARAYAKVLRAHGFKANVGTRID